MRKFDFRLKSVLVLRQRLLNEAEQRYQLAIQKRKDAVLKLNAGYERLNEMNHQLNELRTHRVSGIQQESLILGFANAKASMAALEKAVEDAKRAEVAEQRRYVEANRDCELLVKLKEKQKDAHFQEEMLREQLVQDDLFNARRAILVEK